MYKKSMNFFFWTNYLLDVLKKYIKHVSFSNNLLKLTLKNHNELDLIIFLLKNHEKFQFNVLTDICCVDYLKIQKKRFELNYILLSTRFSYRLVVTILVTEQNIVPSLTKIFSGANWLEREVWDLFGVYFSSHPDLRRILTDYGFDGYPFRKNFPLNGFVEIRYDEDSQYLVYEPVELTQSMRYYDFVNPFSNKNLF